ncbi:hypothetical protein [Achromobacter sp. CSND-B12]|uniref:hypothetical protein n=1 Tax=Achromobacter sp. CSND-B12 TaxID=3462570 RepID=UPI00406A2EAD
MVITYGFYLIGNSCSIFFYPKHQPLQHMNWGYLIASTSSTSITKPTTLPLKTGAELPANGSRMTYEQAS